MIERDENSINILGIETASSTAGLLGCIGDGHKNSIVLRSEAVSYNLFYQTCLVRATSPLLGTCRGASSAQLRNFRRVDQTATPILGFYPS